MCSRSPFIKQEQTPHDSLDLFDAPARLSGDFERTAKEFEIKYQLPDAAGCQKRSVALVYRLEESLYWLISATAIVYLLTGILYLPGVTRPQTERAWTEPSIATSLPAAAPASAQFIVSKKKIAAEAELQHLESLILRTARAAASAAPQTDLNQKRHD